MYTVIGGVSLRHFKRWSRWIHLNIWVCTCHFNALFRILARQIYAIFISFVCFSRVHDLYICCWCDKVKISLINAACPKRPFVHLMEPNSSPGRAICITKHRIKYLFIAFSFSLKHSSKVHRLFGTHSEIEILGCVPESHLSNNGQVNGHLLTVLSCWDRGVIWCYDMP